MTLEELANADRIVGVWWPEGHGERRLAGELCLSGLALTLNGNPEGRFKGGRAQYPVIQGRTALGESLTLVGCAQMGRTSSLQGTETSFRASSLIIGRHLRSRALRFRKLTLGADWLPSWADICGFEVENDFDAGEVSVRYKQPPPLELARANGRSVRIHFGYSAPLGPWGLSKVTVEQRPFLELVTPAALSLSQLREEVWWLESFFAFALGFPCRFDTCLLSHRSYVRRRGWPRQRKRDPILVWDRADSRAMVATGHHEALFSCSELQAWAPRALESWLEVVGRLEPVLGLYYGDLRDGNLFSNYRFLRIVNAVEGFHRRMCHTEDLPTAEHKKRIDDIVNAIPRNWRRWLKGRLRYSNDPSLSTRLTQVIQLASKALGEDLSLTHRNREAIVDTRNYLSHYDLNLEARAIRGDGIVHAARFLRFVLELCLLGQLGFAPEAVSSIYDKWGRRSELIGVLRADWLA